MLDLTLQLASIECTILQRVSPNFQRFDGSFWGLYRKFIHHLMHNLIMDFVQRGDGTGGESIYEGGKPFTDDNFILRVPLGFI